MIEIGKEYIFIDGRTVIVLQKCDKRGVAEVRTKESINPFWVRIGELRDK